MRITYLALICEWSMRPSHESCERSVVDVMLLQEGWGASRAESVEKYLESRKLRDGLDLIACTAQLMS
jgi:hypothetical protein